MSESTKVLGALQIPSLIRTWKAEEELTNLLSSSALHLHLHLNTFWSVNGKHASAERWNLAADNLPLRRSIFALLGLLLAEKLLRLTKPVYCDSTCAAMHCSPQRRAAAAQLACQGSYQSTVKSLPYSLLLCKGSWKATLIRISLFVPLYSWSAWLILQDSAFRSSLHMRDTCSRLSTSCIKHVFTNLTQKDSSDHRGSYTGGWAELFPPFILSSLLPSSSLWPGASQCHHSSQLNPKDQSHLQLNKIKLQIFLPIHNISLFADFSVEWWVCAYQWHLLESLFPHRLSPPPSE